MSTLLFKQNLFVFRNVKTFLVTTLILAVAFLDKGNTRMTRMTRSDPTGPALEEVGEVFLEEGKRMGEFRFSEKTRPRMGKRMDDTDKDLGNKNKFP